MLVSGLLLLGGFSVPWFLLSLKLVVCLVEGTSEYLMCDHWSSQVELVSRLWELTHRSWDALECGGAEKVRRREESRSATRI